MQHGLLQLMTSLHRFRIRKLKVGVEGTYPPYTYHDDNGELTGFDVEVAKALQTCLVWKQISQNLTGISLAGIDSGRLDTVINAVSITLNVKRNTIS